MAEKAIPAHAIGCPRLTGERLRKLAASCPPKRYPREPKPVGTGQIVRR